MANDIESSAPPYDEKAVEVSESNGKEDATCRRSSTVNPEILTGEIYDTRYESTKRGLKSRHAQMIALGGTIGTEIRVRPSEASG
jgi:yeast amino acid transporter